MQELKLGNIAVDVVQKDIKNVHLSVYPPTGRVRISAPKHLDLDAIRVYAISKLPWIKRQQDQFVDQARETPREYLNRESHYYLGKRYLLYVYEHDAPPKVELSHQHLEMFVRPGTKAAKLHVILEEWYRVRLKEIIPGIIKTWEKKMGVEVQSFGVKKMRTKWGSCKRETGRIWLNLELAKKPIECLEYIIVHEMVHFFERHHNQRFTQLLNQYMPKWKFNRDELNRLPISHVDWGY